MFSRLERITIKLPFAIVVAVIKLVCVAWPTSRRIGGFSTRWLFAWAAVGGETLRHCICCSAFDAWVVSRTDVVPPSWAGTGNPQAALLTCSRHGLFG